MKLNTNISLVYIIIFILTGNLCLGQSCSLNVVIAGDNNVLFNDCAYENDSVRFSIYINSITGGSGNYTISNSGNGFVSDNQLQSGDSFVFGWSEDDQDLINPNNSNATFTIDDGAGNVCTLNDINPSIQLYVNLISFAPFCAPQALADTCVNYMHHYQNYNVVDSVYNARFVIISEKALPNNGTIVYQAGNFVRLEDGFFVPASTNFIADIEMCSDGQLGY